MNTPADWAAFYVAVGMLGVAFTAVLIFLVVMGVSTFRDSQRR